MENYSWNLSPKSLCARGKPPILLDMVFVFVIIIPWMCVCVYLATGDCLQCWKWGATARYYASHTNTMLPTRKSIPRSSMQAIRPHEDLTIIKRCELQQYGRVSCSSRLAKIILQGTVGGRRRQGRQRKRWEGNNREWTGLEFGKSQRAVGNREKWRKLLVKSSVVTQRPPRLRDRWGGGEVRQLSPMDQLAWGDDMKQRFVRERAFAWKKFMKCWFSGVLFVMHVHVMHALCCDCLHFTFQCRFMQNKIYT